MKPIHPLMLALGLILAACASGGGRSTPIGSEQEGQTQVAQDLPTAVVATAAGTSSRTAEPEGTPGATIPASTSTEVETQGTPGSLIYFWPDYVPSGYSIHVYADRTMVDDLGYRLHFTAAGYVITVDGGNPIFPAQERPLHESSIEDYCATFLCEPATIGDFVGVKSNATGAGWSFLWELDGHFYTVGATGPAATELEAVVKSLIPVSMEDLTARISQAP